MSILLEIADFQVTLSAGKKVLNLRSAYRAAENISDCISITYLYILLCDLVNNIIIPP